MPLVPLSVSVSDSPTSFTPHFDVTLKTLRTKYIKIDCPFRMFPETDLIKRLANSALIRKSTLQKWIVVPLTRYLLSIHYSSVQQQGFQQVSTSTIHEVLGIYCERAGYQQYFYGRECLMFIVPLLFNEPMTWESKSVFLHDLHLVPWGNGLLCIWHATIARINNHWLIMLQYRCTLRSWSYWVKGPGLTSTRWCKKR